MPEFIEHATGLLGDPDELCAFASDHADLRAAGEPGFGREATAEDWEHAYRTWQLLKEAR